jgi:hypothetical protein
MTQSEQDDLFPEMVEILAAFLNVYADLIGDRQIEKLSREARDKFLSAAAKANIALARASR